MMISLFSKTTTHQKLRNFSYIHEDMYSRIRRNILHGNTSLLRKQGAVFIAKKNMKGEKMKRKEITINGKTLKRIEKELSAEFPEESIRYKPNGTPYLPIESYEERLHSVIGITNYNLHLVDAPIFVEKGTETTFIQTIKIEVISDDNKVVLVKTATGGAEPLEYSDSGKSISLKSDVEIAYTDAFKNVCKKLGIGNELRALRKQINKKESRVEKKSSEAGTERVVLDYSVTILEPMVKEKKLCKALVKTGSIQKIDLIIFETEYHKIGLNTSDFVSKCVPGTTLNIRGYENIFIGEKQLVFVEPLQKRGPGGS